MREITAPTAVDDIDHGELATQSRRGPLGPGRRLAASFPASEIEAAVIDQIRRMIQTPEIVVATWRTAKQTITGLTERRVRECFENFDALWAELFPAEQVGIIHLLVSRIDITESGANIVLKVEGLTSLFVDLQPLAVQSEAA